MPWKEEESELERRYWGVECPVYFVKYTIMINIYISDR